MNKDSIWTTYKCRMNAERRYRSYDLHSHLLTSYYSLLLIIFSIFSDQLHLSEHVLKAIGISLSVAAFSLSLILYGFHFAETANLHRDCYLKLQSLYRSVVGTNADVGAERSYDEILVAYPNHSPRDYTALIVEGALYGHSPLKRPGTDEEVKVTFWTFVKYFGSRLFFALTVYVALFAGPIGVILFLITR